VLKKSYAMFREIISIIITIILPIFSLNLNAQVNFDEALALAKNVFLAVFPNPFEDEVVVETGLRHETITWTVYDLMGKAEAYGQQFNQPSLGINLKSLNKGIYFLSLNNGKSVVTKKMIKI